MTLYGPEYRYGKRLRWWEVLRLALSGRDDDRREFLNAESRIPDRALLR